jgi:hypothetical protein
MDNSGQRDSTSSLAAAEERTPPTTPTVAKSAWPLPALTFGVLCRNLAWAFGSLTVVGAAYVEPYDGGSLPASGSHWMAETVQVLLMVLCGSLIATVLIAAAKTQPERVSPWKTVVRCAVYFVGVFLLVGWVCLCAVMVWAHDWLDAADQHADVAGTNLARVYVLVATLLLSGFLTARFAVLARRSERTAA